MFGLVEADQRVAGGSDRVCHHTEGEPGAAPSRTPQVTFLYCIFFIFLAGHSVLAIVKELLLWVHICTVFCRSTGRRSTCYTSTDNRIKLKVVKIYLPSTKNQKNWLRILPSTSKNMKKNLDFYCVVTSLYFLSSINDVKDWAWKLTEKIKGHWQIDQDTDPHPHPLVKGTDP